MSPRTTSVVDGRVERGDRTRRHILDLAVDLASVNGLDGLSLGDLADRLKMSKSGLFAAFGSKEELQLATVNRAAEIFVDEVIRIGISAPRGLPRLYGLCEAWLVYAQGDTFRGGCFFANVASEFDAKPGPVRDLISQRMREWLDTIATAVRKAQKEGHLKPTDVDQLVFELNSFTMAANWSWQLHRDPRAFDRALVGVRSRLALEVTKKGLQAAGLLGSSPTAILLAKKRSQFQ
ncbi:MAG: TetR/AcrR family transcriptional regulator [Deltaproteobacteria bacterium]|nr:TetR/AcrR family transcriptional regulator [Deltaproteobacteria bacterium]